MPGLDSVKAEYYKVLTDMEEKHRKDKTALKNRILDHNIHRSELRSDM